MAYSEALALRLRTAFGGRDAIMEKKMFGGLAFMIGGHMCCGVIGDRLMARVGADAYDDALARPHVSPMDFTGRALRGFVYVDPAGIESDADLQTWVEACRSFVESLPPKE